LGNALAVFGLAVDGGENGEKFAGFGSKRYNLHRISDVGLPTNFQPVIRFGGFLLGNGSL